MGVGEGEEVAEGRGTRSGEVLGLGGGVVDGGDVDEVEDCEGWNGISWMRGKRNRKMRLGWWWG